MWVPIALSRDLPPGTTRAVISDGKEYVLWRGGDGSLQLWEDRCPHRGMRLSLGFVRGNTLNCLYHGWEYAAAAQCVRIPAHPDLVVPGTIKANAFTVIEAGAMIWTSDGSIDDPPMIARAQPLCSLAIHAPSQAIIDAFGAETSQVTQSWITRLAGATLLIGWHAVDETKTMLHAVLAGDGDARAATQMLRDRRDQLETELMA